MTKEELILAAVERIETRQEQQRVSHEEFKSLLAAHAVHIAELQAGHARHREDHKRERWWIFTGVVTLLGASGWYIWRLVVKP